MTRSHPRRRRAGVLAVVVLLGAGLASICVPAHATGATSRPELGFPIGRTDHADGSWVGRYRVGHQLAFRIQPRKSNVESGYRRARPVSHAPGAGVVVTERAAWVLSTYGRTPDPTTAAAVDVAVHALLSGGRWRVGTAYTSRRTNATGNGRFIRAYARAVLRQSRHRRGPYRTSLTATRVPAGNQTTVTVRVQNMRGLGPVITDQQRGLAVDVTYHGTRHRTVFLNSHGVGRVFFRAAAGRTRITAAVHLVPDVKPFLRRPRNRAASQVAVAGHQRTLRLRGSGLGVSTQTVAITSGSRSVLVAHPLHGSYSVTGLTGHETVDYAVYGPFTTSSTSCTGTALMSTNAIIRSNGTRSLPRWAPARTGYYAWAVAAHGNATTRPASVCGSAYLAGRKTGTDQSRLGADAAVKVGHAFGVEITVSGFDRPETHTAETRVYGPFLHKDKARCTGNRLFRTLPSTISNNKQWNKTTVVGSGRNTGYYVFQTTLAPGTFMRTSRSWCGSAVQVVR